MKKVRKKLAIPESEPFTAQTVIHLKMKAYIVYEQSSIFHEVKYSQTFLLQRQNYVEAQ